MPFPSFQLCGAGICLLVWMGFTEKAVGQVSGSSRSSQGVLIGRVIDTAGTALGDAEVVVTRSRDSVVVGSAATDRFGDVILRDLPPGAAYTVRVRKIGYLPAQQPDVSFGSSDTLVFEVKLRPFTQLLPELVARENALPPVASVSDGLILKPFPFFKCFAIGVEFPIMAEVLSLFGVRQSRGSVAKLGDKSPYDCSEQADNKKLARRVQKLNRRVEQATGAGRRPQSSDADTIRWIAQACGGDIATNDILRCREVLKRTPQDRLVQALAAITAEEQTREAARREKEEAEGAATIVQQVTRRLERAHRAGRPADSSDALLVRNVAQTCVSGAPPDDRLILCREILKRTRRATLERLLQVLTAADATEQRDTAQSTLNQNSAHGR